AVVPDPDAGGQCRSFGGDRPGRRPPRHLGAVLMRAPALLSILVALAGCQGIFGIPSEGTVGCPSPCTGTVSGQVIFAQSPTGLGRPSGTVKLTSVDPPQTVTSGADGSYSFSGLEPGTPLQFSLSLAQTNPDPMGIDTSIDAGETTMSDVQIDLPIVEYR